MQKLATEPASVPVERAVDPRSEDIPIALPTRQSLPTTEPGPHWNVLDAQPGAWSFGVWKNFVVGIWSQRGNAVAVQSLSRVGESVKGSYSAIHIIRDGTGLPTPDGRAALVELLTQRTGKLATVTVVLQGHGFWASAVQSALTGIHMVVPRASVKLRICESIDDAVVHLPGEHAAITGVQVTAPELHALLTNAVASTANKP